jgi:hypothetical protein
MRRTAMVLTGLLLIVGVGWSEEVLRRFDWTGPEAPPLPPKATIKGGDLEIVCDAAGGSVPVLVIPDPGIDTQRWALRTKLRYDEVVGSGYLEMWSHFPDGGQYFSRSLGNGGPMGKIEGSADWRVVVLPFFSTAKEPPVALDLNLVLPGAGTVVLGPIELVQYEDTEDPLTPAGAWWDQRTAGLIGGGIGALIGVMGGLIGILCGRGKAEGVVVSLMHVMKLVGLAGLALGIVALAVKQPYAVWYPPLLIGVICTSLGFALTPTVRRRYAELEDRRMRAHDL